MDKARWWQVLVDGKPTIKMTSFSQKVALRQARRMYPNQVVELQDHPWNRAEEYTADLPSHGTVIADESDDAPAESSGAKEE
jgi:hypothetical protein